MIRFNLRRPIVIGIIIIVSFLLQTTLFKTIAFVNVSPNLLIVVTAALGFMRGKKEGMYVGVACGLLIDLFYGEVLGFYTMLYAIAGYVNGTFRKEFFPEDIRLPMVLISGSDISINMMIYLVMFLFRGRFQFGYFALNIMMPEMVYTLLISIPLYFIILKANQKLEAIEKRSALKFGGKDKELFS